MTQKNRIENVIINGAGGTLRRMLVEELVKKRQFRVSALVRPSSQSQLPDCLAGVYIADQSNHKELVAALRGQDAFIITIAPGLPLDSQKPLINAAIEAGVEYIMPNEYSLDYNNHSLAKDVLMGEAALDIRRYIQERSGGKTSSISLSCSFWYEFCLVGSDIRFGFDFDNKRLTLIDDGKTKITVTTWMQCALAIANLFVLPIEPEAGYTGATLSNWKNDAVFVSSFEVNQRDMLASVLRVTGESESGWEITFEDSKELYQRGLDLKNSGDVSGIPLLVVTRVFFPDGGGSFSHKTVNEKLGLPEEDLDSATKEAFELHETAFWENRRATIAARSK